MIVRMDKYTIVSYYKGHEEFLKRLQELGLVDITTVGWEPDERERRLLTEYEQHKSAADRFDAMVKDEDFEPGEPYSDSQEAFDRYLEAAVKIEELDGRIAKARKEEAETAVWGDFIPAELHGLAEKGIAVRFFSVYSNEYDSRSPQWGEDYIVEEISRSNGMSYFVVVAPEGTEVAIDAQELKAPSETVARIRSRINELEEELKKWKSVMARAAASADMIAEHGRSVLDELNFSRVAHSGAREAEDALIIMEGWAPQADSEKVVQLLESEPGVVYFRERPTPEDQTPVLLKNNRYARLFEFIGNFYSLPKYGSLDLTPYFAPFYMIFFGFCLGDAGYGLLFVILSFVLRKVKPEWKHIASLTLWCGASTVVFGFLVGSFFGIQLPGLPMFRRIHDLFLSGDDIFYIALGLGVVQILFGMALKVINISIQFGFKYSLGTIGWMIVIVSTLAALFAPSLGGSFSMSSPIYIGLLCLGLALMLLFHNPDKNPLKNIGPGLWNTYNDVTGLMGDVLSYIRLFALCLSGGTLALVFNDLAFGLAPDIPLLKELFIIVILLIGHGINLFMSSLGAFVHPMRLTFVEFYKNAGFEASQRTFTPFRKEKAKKQ